MGKSTTHIWSLICLALVLVLSCNAPHQNPLDPENSNTGYASFAGYTVNAQEQPLAGVHIIWRNENRIVTSDKNGHFEFENLLPDSGWVVFSKPGFLTDSLQIYLQKNDSYSARFFLFAAPLVYGHVSAIDAPHHSLSDVVVIWRNENRLSLTDSSGYYQFADVQNNDGWLVFHKNGFVADSVYVEWLQQTIIEKNIILYQSSNIVLSGNIKHELGSSTPVPDVRVTWEPASRFTFTDSQGNFSFSDIPNTDGRLYFEKEGYKPDSVLVTWGGHTNRHLLLQMNAKPVLASFQIFSRAQYDYPDRFKIALSVSAIIQDEERDTFKAFIECPALDINNLYLLYNPTTLSWSRDFVHNEIEQINDIRELVGHDFDLKITDYSMDTFTLAKGGIKRVVLEEIELKSPLSGLTTSASPTFEWRAIEPGFEYSYILQIFTDDLFNPQLVKEYTFASNPENFSMTIPDRLSNGYYIWAIWCVDEFGNRARSKQAKFTVGE